MWTRFRVPRRARRRSVFALLTAVLCGAAGWAYWQDASGLTPTLQFLLPSVYVALSAALAAALYPGGRHRVAAVLGSGAALAFGGLWLFAVLEGVRALARPALGEAFAWPVLFALVPASVLTALMQCVVFAGIPLWLGMVWAWPFRGAVSNA